MAKANLGSANNTNEEVKNLDIPAGLTEEQFKAIVEHQKRMFEQRSTNKVEIAGQVVEKRQTEPKMVMDKETKAPSIDENGEIRYYKVNFFVKIVFTGGEKEINVSEDWYNKLDYNKTYLFNGRLGLVKSFGKEVVDIVFQNFIEL